MVIACVVPATEDSANITAWQLAQDHDPEGERTIGERHSFATLTVLYLRIIAAGPSCLSQAPHADAMLLCSNCI
jgi:hypothetical protein